MGQKREKERQRVVDHRHCTVCGRAIPSGEQFCSPDCREKYELSKEREKRTRTMMIVIYVILIIAMVVMFLILPRS